MGSRGPTPKTKAANALAGNPGKRSNAAKSPDPAKITNLRPPAFLPREAKKEWKRVVMELARLDLISDLDVMALAAYCNAFATWVSAMKNIREHGTLVRSPNGYAMPSPYIKIQRDAQDEMLKWLREFGMTPAARTRVLSDDSDSDDDPFSVLAKRAAENRSRGGDVA
jgi:P27 family predicted phage terminase small subunit